MEFMYDYRHPDIEAKKQGVVSWGFESFELDDWNLVKIQIPHDDGNIEPAWVYVSDEDKRIYDAGGKTEIIPCVLRNSSKYFPLGAYIPLVLDGTARPTANTKHWVGGCYHHPDEQRRILKTMVLRARE